MEHVRDIVYHICADGHKVSLEIWIPSVARATDSLPVVIYFHGGGMISGSSEDPPSHFIDACQSNTAILVSANYRLWVPSTAEDTIEDVKALLAFVADPRGLSTHLPENVKPDASRIAVHGSSGGGVPALFAAHAAPRPRSIILWYPMGTDWLHDCWIVPHKVSFGQGTELDATRCLDLLQNPQGTISSNKLTVTVLSPTNVIIKDEFQRADLFPYLIEKGLFLDQMTQQPGLSAGLAERAREEREAAIPQEVRHLFPQLNIDQNHPATFLMHSKDDMLIPIEGSRHFVSRLEEKGVRHRTWYFEKEDHAFSERPIKSDEVQAAVSELHAAVFEGLRA